MNIKILNMVYKVKRILNLKDNLGNEVWGEISPQNGTIKLRKPQTLESEYETLWHEALHGISEVYSMYLSEEQVILLSVAVVSILQNNKRMRSLNDYKNTRRSNSRVARKNKSIRNSGGMDTPAMVSSNLSVDN